MASPEEIDEAVAKTVDQAAEFNLTPAQSALLWSLLVPRKTTDLLLVMWWVNRFVLERIIWPLKTSGYVNEVDGLLSRTESGGGVADELQKKSRTTYLNLFQE